METRPPHYTIYWNVSTDSPMMNVKTVRIIITWPDRGTQKSITLDYLKADVI